MIIVMKPSADERDVQHVVSRVQADGYQAHLSQGEHHTIIGVIGESPTPLREDNYSSLGGCRSRHACLCALQTRQP